MQKKAASERKFYLHVSWFEFVPIGFCLFENRFVGIADIALQFNDFYVFHCVNDYCQGYLVNGLTPGLHKSVALSRRFHVL